MFLLNGKCAARQSASVIKGIYFLLGNGDLMMKSFFIVINSKEETKFVDRIEFIMKLV